ncbi:ATP-binding protein [Pontibacter mangrovi]|uniref:histidine kinase n=1 Tax=Pontibacter mangrovi TaxID=2589816 RepID=A0A501WCG6_9BACT|nr:ATP-binding protein [Pontibacter mangrovi]TPE46185.1 GAF domain-containing protein [Pontibacter mangrovi]
MQNYQNFNVDLSNCDSEPIHLIGRIQPHGFLVILNRQSLVVEQVSQNIGCFLAADVVTLPGQPLQALTSPGEYEELLANLNAGVAGNAQLLELQGKKFLGFLHQSQGSLVLECEPYESQASDRETLELLSAYSSLQAELDRVSTLQEQAELTVKFIQKFITYDHVMLYRFDEDWHGEVIAEKLQGEGRSYLHHHFPATDIPAQARELLVKKTVRQIVDVSAPAVDIKPYLNPATGQPSNIILSELRNPSEIHLEYLQNMGVQATLSLSIVVGGKLWGIIACQHKSAHFVNYWKRQVCNNVAQAFANNVLAQQEHRDVQQLKVYRQKKDALVQQLMRAPDLGEELQKQPERLLSINAAGGVALLLGGHYFSAGAVPDKEDVQGLVDWLSASMADGLFCTRELSAHFPAASKYKQLGSGLLALEVSKFNNEFLLYFKPEITEARIWAGKPEKNKEEVAGRIHPRKSFSGWSQQIKEKSQPWALNEVDVAQMFVKDLTAIMLRNQKKDLLDLNEKLQLSGEMMQAKNRRLEDFTKIIAHNLRSPLSNMEGLTDLYLEQPSGQERVEIVQHMRNVIRNMGNTLEDMNQILENELNLHLSFTEVNLADVVDKELQNLQAALLERKAHVEKDLQVANVWAPKVYMESIAHNLISNALKYSSPERVPEIYIKSWQEAGKVYFSVSDNGLGIDLKRHGHKLFGLYRTFHVNKNAKGLGLYLTKAQVEAMGGDIKVDSAPKQGTTFTVILNQLT